MGQLSDMRLYGVFCPCCGICFFPSEEVKVGLPEVNGTCTYGELNLEERGDTDSVVVDFPVYHADCVD